MAIRNFKKSQTTNSELDKVQDDISYVLQPILQSAIINGVQVNGVLIGTGPTSVNHGLGRTPLGCIIVDRDAAPVPWTLSKNKQTIVLQASSSVTVNLWIY